MKVREYLKGKRVLVVGLGLLGGGAATARWLAKHGARLTVTDLRSRRELAPSIEALGRAAQDTRFVLGRHDQADFQNHDLVVVNPAVPLASPHLSIVRKAGVPIENELTLFLRFCKNPIVGITGTRGKTTTATWAHHFLKSRFSRAVLTGNTAQNPFLEVLDRLDGVSPVVAEISSFQLELLAPPIKPPKAAVITNLMRDHLNRHGTMSVYANTKANIFRSQDKNGVLVLPRKSAWTRFFLKQKPRRRLIFYDSKPLGFGVPAWFKNQWGGHNLANLRAAAHAAHAAGARWGEIEKRLKNLPTPRFRQEVIFQKGNFRVVNDATATTPDATIAAIRRFAREPAPLFLIAGGTDKDLDFRKWARIIERKVAPGRLILLEGSATKKMLGALSRSFRREVRVFGRLRQCVQTALAEAGKLEPAVVLFSPGGTSFEKFQNEFDRGEQFQELIKSNLGRKIWK